MIIINDIYKQHNLKREFFLKVILVFHSTFLIKNINHFSGLINVWVWESLRS